MDINDAHALINYLDRELTARGILPTPHLGEAFRGQTPDRVTFAGRDITPYLAAHTEPGDTCRAPHPAAAPKLTIADVEQAIDRATDALWRLLPGGVQDGYGRDTARRWATAVIDAAGAPPDECGPPVDPTTGPTYRVGRRNPWCIYRGGERFAITFDPADGPRVVAALNAHAVDPAATDNACPNPDQSTHPAGSRPNMCPTCAPTQCPRCTSDRRDFRYADPKAPGLLRDAPFCTDPWHDLCGNPNPNDDGGPCTHPAGHAGDHYSRNPDGGVDTWGQARLFVKCGAAGGDGLTCQRPTGHDPDPDGHAAGHDAGLVRW